MFSLREEIEKDSDNLHIKNILSLEKNKDKKTTKALIFGTQKNNPKIYCIVQLELKMNWKTIKHYNFNNFSQAIKKFAECRKEYLASNNLASVNL